VVRRWLLHVPSRRHDPAWSRWGCRSVPQTEVGARRAPAKIPEHKHINFLSASDEDTVIVRDGGLHVQAPEQMAESVGNSGRNK
jgi:hypothetical protein